MHDQSKAKLRRLSIWFTVNLVIFVACYLNYRLQLKHRYLYKTLSVGLCLSRAAAMVINFNLILVWIPMCKYTLTRLAVTACGYNHRQKIKLNYLISSKGLPSSVTGHEVVDQQKDAAFQVVPFEMPYRSDDNNALNRSILYDLAKKFKVIAIQANLRVKHSICKLKIKAINSFLIAVDHSTSLHTISATTITLASVIHTVAHLMNVINFSNNYDPLLSNLNMAEYRGQNPLQLLVSVPGITGCFMILILILMSLSSISAIRNSSFDLFQVFHRLSVLFVILLILHPSSHVLKEQSNVDRHHPDICYDEMTKLRDEILSVRANFTLTQIAARTGASSLSAIETGARHQARVRRSSNLAPGIPQNVRQQTDQKGAFSPSYIEPTSISRSQQASGDITKSTIESSRTSNPIKKREIVTGHDDSERRLEINTSNESDNDAFSDVHHDKLTGHRISVILQNSSAQDRPTVDNPLCRDIVPLFVSQDTICWYVLGAGLSCYLMDLILRRLRRNKNPIELLDVRSDAEGNLIELTLSNNHERFAYWLPGQFVYLNCPQIATYEWHPFTISSMDNRTRQFTLHIKTGGDWTRKLRHELKLRQQQQQQAYYQPCNGRNSMSLFPKRNTYSIKHCCNFHFRGNSCPGFESEIGAGGQAQWKASCSTLSAGQHQQCIKLANFDCYDQWSGQSRVQCGPVNCCPPLEDNGMTRKQSQLNDTVKTELDQQCKGFYSICCWCSFSGDQNRFNSTAPIKQQIVELAQKSKLDLYIDGPFHSPFERLLEQQVSICIANGVGWTAFSSVFQQITNTSYKRLANTKDDWWSQWHDYISSKPKRQNMEPIGDSKCTNIDRVPPTLRLSTDSSEQKLSNETKLHLMIIVTTIEQLKPFYNIVMRYYERVQSDLEREDARVYNPVKEITAYITRSTKHDADVVEFCHQERLDPIKGTENSLMVNKTFTILFGKPNFDSYLSEFSTLYEDKRKISIYCCGSYEVKRTVEKICQSLNRYPRPGSASKPIYCYHEENF